MMGFQSVLMVPREENRTRKRAANAPALATADMNPVTGVGAPWYTSGVHMWNGTAATLKANPTSIRVTPAKSSPLDNKRFLERKSAIWVRLFDPVAP